MSTPFEVYLNDLFTKCNPRHGEQVARTAQLHGGVLLDTSPPGHHPVSLHANPPAALPANPPAALPGYLVLPTRLHGLTGGVPTPPATPVPVMTSTPDYTSSTNLTSPPRFFFPPDFPLPTREEVKHLSTPPLTPPNTPSSFGKTPKQKRTRTRYTSSQLGLLEKEFNEASYISKEGRRRLAEQIGLTSENIRVWFQNKRTLLKKKANNRPKTC